MGTKVAPVMALFDDVAQTVQILDGEWDSPVGAALKVGDDIVSGAMALAGNSERYKFVAGVIRNFNDGQGWRLIKKPEVPGHYAFNVGAIVTNAGDITIDISLAGGIDIVSSWACADETLSRAGMRVAASITAAQIKLFIQTPHNVADYVSWNGAAWVSANGVFAPAFAGSVLTLTHTSTPINRNGYQLSVTPRSTTVDAVAGSANNTTCQVQFIDRATNTVLAAPTTECKVYVARGIADSGTQVDEDPRNIHEGTYPGGNIWFGAIVRTS